MRRLAPLTDLLTTFILLASTFCIPAQAVPTIDIHHVDINREIMDPPSGGLSNYVSWMHQNPYTGDYETALINGLIDAVTLTIDASGIQTADYDTVNVSFWDKGDVMHPLGPLQEGSNTFTLIPSWLDDVDVDVKAQITFVQNPTGSDPKDNAHLNWSELAVTSHPADNPATPAPGAILLGSIGVAFVGWLRRRRTI